MGGDFFGGGNAVEGLSPKTSERQQRLNETVSRLGTQGALDQTALFNFLVGGGEFTPGVVHNSGQPIFGNFQSQPTGPAFNVINTGIQGEQGLSTARQQIAQQLLNQAQGSLVPANEFQLDTLGQAGASLQAQGGLLGSELGTFFQNRGLDQQATNQLQQFFESGGAPSDVQQNLIGDIFDAQRQVGQSNLQQQFGQALRDLQDQATTRGLRFGDTPIQDRGGLLTQEFIRNAANLETALGGQEASALLDQPFRQAGLAGTTSGQAQGQMLDILNAFTTSIGRGFDVNNQLQAQNQFGLQFSPATASGAPLQNLAGLLGSGGFTQNIPSFSPIPVAQQPSFSRTFGQSFAGAFGGGLGSGAASGVNQGLSGGIANNGGQPGFTTSTTQSLAGSAGGGGGGGSFAGLAAAFSHPRFKENIIHIPDEWGLEAVREIPIYRWQYKEGDDATYTTGMTTDMPEAIIAGNKDERNAYHIMSYIGMLTAAIRALDNRLEALTSAVEEGT